MKSKALLLSLALLASTSLISQASLVWTVGVDDNDWPLGGTTGGAATAFVQENGAINALPGSPFSTNTPQGADNDYYFAGTYTTALPGNVAVYGSYSPMGAVAADELGAERAYAGGDLDLRYHFNLPGSYGPNDQAVITFDALNLDDTVGTANMRFGIELYFNGVLVRPLQVIALADLHIPFSSAPFTLGSVGADTTAGADNIISLRGISYNAEGGGNWMGIDYVSLDITPVPEPGSSALMIAVLLGGTSLFRRRRPTV